MKTLLIILISITIGLGASAQRKGGFYHVYAPRVIVTPSIGFGFGYGYPYFGYPYYGYPFGYPNPYGYRGTPQKLSLEIQSIKLDYKNQIRDVRHDKPLNHSQRRQEIRTLKNERDHAIFDAEQNFRYGNNNNQNRRPNNNSNQNPVPNNNQNPGANNQFQDNGSTNSGSNP